MYYVISRESSQTIYTSQHADIEILQFSNKLDANKYLLNQSEKVSLSDKIDVFTDGACSNNGGKNAKAGIGIYFKKNDPRNVSERIKGKQTNNTAELSAIIKVFEILDKEIKQNKKVVIYSDSKYSIQCFTKWAITWSRNGWKKKGSEIINSELIQLGYKLLSTHKNVSLEYVKAHTGNMDYISRGNEQADKLATLSIQ